MQPGLRTIDLEWNLCKLRFLEKINIAPLRPREAHSWQKSPRDSRRGRSCAQWPAPPSPSAEAPQRRGQRPPAPRGRARWTSERLARSPRPSREPSHLRLLRGLPAATRTADDPEASVSEASFAGPPGAGKVRHAGEVPRGHRQAATAGQQSGALEVGDQLPRLARLRAETGTA